MMLIRPITSDDLEALYSMAQETGVGVTSLPADYELLSRRIEISERSFAKTLEPEEASFLFALEDTEEQRVVGVSGIMARVGLDEVWYNYRVSNTVNASKELGLHKQTPTLYLSNDMTDHSEICTLFLRESYRNKFNGHFLSKVRFLFLADFADQFSDKIFAEMRGYFDDEGRSPFWEDLGKKFFSMDFTHADYLSGIGKKSFIAELMPKYPIYLPFLSEAAREVVGRVHPNTRPALSMLEREGFHFNGLIDIFDAGPLVETYVKDIRCVRESIKRHVMAVQKPVELQSPMIISNRSFENFRATLVDESQMKDDAVGLAHNALDALKLQAGDIARLVTLKPKRNES